MKHGFVDHTGSREAAQCLKLSTSHEPLDLLNFEKSSKSDFNRALVQAYGGDGCGSTQFHDEYTKHLSKTAAEEQFRSDIVGNSRALNLPMYELQLASLVPERYRRPAGVSPYIDTMDDRHSASGEVLSRRYLDEGKVHKEMPRREFLNDATFSGQSSVATGLYQNSNNPYSHGKLAEDVAIHYQQSCFPLPDPKYSSYSLCSSLRSSFDNSVQPYDGSPSVHTLAQVGASSTNGSTPLSAKHLDSRRPLHFDRGYYGLDNSLQPSDCSPAVQTLAQIGPSSIHGSTPLRVKHLDSHRPFNFDRGYYGSGSALLPRKSSPYFSGPEMESSMQQGPQGDIPPSAGWKIQENSWEPSEHFRSSFCAPAGKSSSRSQYDPPVDSIAPHKAENLKSSPITIIHNFSSQYINDDPILSGHTAEYSSQKYLSSLHHSMESISDKKISAHQFCRYITPVAAPGPETIVGENNSTSRDEKHWVPHATDDKSVSGADLGGSTRNQADKASNGKEPKALRIFREGTVKTILVGGSLK